MKYFLKLSIILFFVNSSAFAQLSVSVNGNNPAQIFDVADQAVNLGQNSFLHSPSVISGDINKLTGVAHLLKSDAVNIHAPSSEQLFSTEVSTVIGDESLKIYAGANGSFIIRENIANFLFYDASGDIIQSISNSSQSTEGESISELASDPLFKTIVLFNPKIVRDGVEGSRARLVESNYTTEDFFYSSEEAIRNVKVSNDGQYIGVISYGSGNDKLNLFDRYGNEINTISFDQAIMDFEFTANGSYVTIRSNGRVGVYNTLSAERVGSTSFRSRLHYATYVPEDQTIIAMTAEKTGDVLSDIEFHAINIELRSIERKSINRQLGTTSKLPISLERNSSYNYRVLGFNNAVVLKINF